MEKLKQLIAEFKSRRPCPTEEELVNLAREFLQVLLLKLIFQSKFGASLSFMGGTALRICHDLKRYSEDLDFALDGLKDGLKEESKASYRFDALVEFLKKELSLSGFSTTTNVHDEKIVQKAMVSFEKLGEVLGWKSFRQGQKMHIKLEVDVRPISLKKGERESFFVHRFGEIFPILRHTLPTLFAGKILAILHRPYARGRDYYDLIWYLSRKTELNIDYLNRGIQKEKFSSVPEVYKALSKKIQEVQPEVILKDIGRFLEDSREIDWISHYGELFDQLTTT